MPVRRGFYDIDDDPFGRLIYGYDSLMYSQLFKY